MAFSSFGTPSMGSPTPAAIGGVQNGPDLETIQTEALGFLALAGDAKVQLLPTPWPSDQLPPPTASLMSIASRKGLIAAAGPDAVIIARTKSVRMAFEGKESGDNNVKPFQPELTLPMQMRVSQLTFSADESYLVISAENGGGLAVYDVDSLLKGSTNSAFELSTNGQSLRALTPNPTPEKGELLAVVTVDGNLMMANLKERSFVTGPNGQVLKDGVSCVSWSTKGKQLVAGLGNGTAYQMTPEGMGKGDIPKPPNVGAEHVSSITWLENHVFLMVHTPSKFDSNNAPLSSFHIVSRQLPNFVFQKIDDPCGAYGLNRSPPHHFLLRLKDFPPNIQDVLFVTSSAATDIGLFTRSNISMTSTHSAEEIAGIFTLTEFSDDSRRAQIPPSGDMSDTSPIGFALDLSGDEKVYRPIPGDEEINEASTPLPALVVLNHEGALAAWWFVYTESVRERTIYPGLIAAPPAAQPTETTPAQAQTTSAFGASSAFSAPQPATNTAFGAPSAFSALKPATTSAFGAPASSSPSTGAFGATTSVFGVSASSAPSAGAFGATSGLGQKSSPWDAPATSAPQTGGSSFEAPAFGAAATLGGGTAFGKPAFGATSTPTQGLLGRQSVWGSGGGSTAPQAAFGQASGLNKPATPFGSAANTGSSAPSTGGFSAFATQGGFPSAPQNTGGSIFGKPAAASPFGASSTPATNIFGGGSQNDNKTTASVFGAASQAYQPKTSIFGGTPQAENKPFGNAGGFNLGTSFKPNTAAENDEQEKDEPKSSFFGGGFSSALGDTSKSAVAETPVSKEADMDSNEVAKPEATVKDSTTPSTTLALSKFSSFSSFSTTQGGLFGSTSPQPSSSTVKDSTTPSTTLALSKFSSLSTTPGGLFGSTSPQPSSSTAKPVSAGFNFGQPPAGNSPQPSLSTTKPASAGFSFGQPSASDKPQGLNFSNLTKSTAPSPKTPTASAFNPPVTTSATPETPKIKTEPESSGFGGVSSNIPEAPLPPESTSKTSYAAGESSDSSFASIETDSPTPSGSIAKPPPKAALPLPSAADPPALKPIPKDLIPPMDVPGGPEDDGGSSGFSTEDDEDDHSQGTEEGSGEDVTKDLSPISVTDQTPAFTPQSSFNVLKKEASSNLFQKIEKPSQPAPRVLFGEGSSAPLLQPPKPKAPLSPRSPSPVRAGAVPQRLLRPDASRSVSAPGAASQLLGQRPVSRPSGSTQNTYALALEQQKAEEKRREEARARKEQEESRALKDADDDGMQRELAEDLNPTRILDEFRAYTDHTSVASVESIPDQVEVVYRDINKMVDTLGINAKNLKAFIEAHTNQYKESGREREDLDHDDEWVLVEVEELTRMVDRTLTRELESGRVKEVAAKLEACNDIQKDLIRLRAKHEDIKKIIDTHRDTDLENAQARAQPLSAEQLAQQKDLRQEYTNFQLLLSQAEEALTLLKTKFVSQATSNGRPGGSTVTVEAVMRTITKMTSMAEKRSGDIDVLENQMRKLRFGSVMSASSREGSPFTTPQANRQSLRNPGTSSTYGLFYTPDSTRDTQRNMRDSILSNSGSFAMSSPAPRKKLSGYSPEEKAQLRNKLAKRKSVVDKLRGALQNAGSNVRLMDDDE